MTYLDYDPSDTYETEPTCDICERSMFDSPNILPKMREFESDWNGETGCHRSCELSMDPTNAQEPDYKTPIMYEVLDGGETGYFAGDILNARCANIIKDRGGSVAPTFLNLKERTRKDCE